MARAAKLAGAAIVCAFAVAWIFYVRLYEHRGDRRVRFADVSAAIPTAQFPRPLEKVFRDRAALEAFVPPPAAAIDFAHREAVLVAAGPRSSTGYSLDVLRVTEERSRIVVVVRERTPQLGDPVQARVTYPYRLITLPRTEKPVKIEWQGRP
jgi:protease stability complex PrcB-like protein